ncbi:MAG TPA: DUF4129 domain-containing protein [Actinomycetes bacterium]
MEDDRRGRIARSAGPLLPLAVGILALVAVIGAGAHDALRLSDRGPLAGQRDSVLAVGTILLMLDILIIATVHMLMRRRRRRMRPPEATDRWQEPIEPDIRWIRLVLGIAIALAVLLPLLLLLAALRQVDPQRDSNASRRTVPSLHPPDTVSVPLLLTLLTLAIAVVVVWTVVVLRRAGAWRRVQQLPQAQQEEPRDDEGDAPDAAVLGSAVRAGEAALTTAADPRMAIIACYEAMEAVLTEHGSARNESDTPTEFLDRAVGAGLIRSDAAGTLTDLFREARFSRHPLGERDREAAIGALARLRAEVDQIAVSAIAGQQDHPNRPGPPSDGDAGADWEVR